VLGLGVERGETVAAEEDVLWRQGVGVDGGLQVGVVEPVLAAEALHHVSLKEAVIRDHLADEVE